MPIFSGPDMVKRVLLLALILSAHLAPAFSLRPPPPLIFPASYGSRTAALSQTSMALFKDLRDFVFRRRRPKNVSVLPKDQESLTKYQRFRQVMPVPPPNERRRYALGGASSSLPSMEALWAEAWPTAACKDAMERQKALSDGDGPPQAGALTRKFGHNETLRAIFYKDAASWCPYCASVWMTLEEKCMPYTLKRINLLSYGEKPEWIYDISGTGLLPLLEVNGRMIRESVEICKSIDKWQGFDEGVMVKPRRLWPDEGDALHAEAEALLGLERDLFRDWFVYLFEKPESHGHDEFWTVLRQVESALAKYAESPWFLPGTEPSLVDIIFAPKVERVIASCLYWKGLTLRQHPDLPALSRWLDALDHRPSYAAFKADFFTLINSLEPLFGRAYSVNTPEVAELQQKLDGFHPTAWRLPVSEEEKVREYLPEATQPTELYARQSAAVRLIINHKRLPRYMLRALGVPGPEFRSPLADPFNQIDEWALPEVETAYRYLILALLRGRDYVDPLLAADKSAAESAYGSSEEERALARARMVACLEYLKYRIGVPRDMTLAEARQVRGTLTWLVEALK